MYQWPSFGCESKETPLGWQSYKWREYESVDDSVEQSCPTHQVKENKLIFYLSCYILGLFIMEA